MSSDDSQEARAATKLKAQWKGYRVRKSAIGQDVREILDASREEGQSKSKQFSSPFVITSDKVLENQLKVVPITSQDTFLDIGCGDGRVCRYIREKTGCASMGQDYNAEQIARAEAMTMHTVPNMQVLKSNQIYYVCEDIRNESVMAQLQSLSSVVFVFMLPSTNEYLCNQLVKYTQPGTRVITHLFPLVHPQLHKVAVQSEQAAGDYESHILVYTVK